MRQGEPLHLEERRGESSGDEDSVRGLVGEGEEEGGGDKVLGAGEVREMLGPRAGSLQLEVDEVEDGGRAVGVGRGANAGDREVDGPYGEGVVTGKERSSESLDLVVDCGREDQLEDRLDVLMYARVVKSLEASAPDASSRRRTCTRRPWSWRITGSAKSRSYSTSNEAHLILQAHFDALE